MWYEYIIIAYLIITLCIAIAVLMSKNPVRSGVFLWPYWVPMCFIEALRETMGNGKN